MNSNSIIWISRHIIKHKLLLLNLHYKGALLQNCAQQGRENHDLQYYTHTFRWDYSFWAAWPWRKRHHIRSKRRHLTRNRQDLAFQKTWIFGNERINFTGFLNPLNPELNPICYLLALLAHHFLHVSRIRVKSLTIRLLMSYIYIYIYIWSAYSWCF